MHLRMGCLWRRRRLGAGQGRAAAADGNGGEATERPAARDELWVPIVLLVLVAGCSAKSEWW